MNKLSILASATALLVGLGGLVSSAQAAWTFQGTSAAAAIDDPAAKLTTLSGLSVANGSSNAGFGSGAAWATTALTDQSNALGMTSGNESTNAPYHAIDNSARTEAVLLGFDASVVLTSIGLSYSVYQDQTASSTTDVSLFRYIGGGDPPSLLNGVAPTAMTGWELVGNYGDFKKDTSDPFNLVNSAAKGSSWWLISAYNSGFTGAGETRGDLDNGNDFFKLSAVAGYATPTTSTPPTPSNGVPEPGSLALAGLALLGVYAGRRRQLVRG